MRRRANQPQIGKARLFGEMPRSGGGMMVATRRFEGGGTYVGTTYKPLEALYEEVFGRKPHWKMKPETMRERLNDAGHQCA